MKKLLIIFIVLFVISFSPSKVYADDSIKPNIDSSIYEILDGIKEEDFEFLTNFLNSLFNDDKSFKDRLVSFITGDISISIDSVISYFKSSIFGMVEGVLKLLSYILFIAISSSVLNIIISKNSDNNEKSIIYFICYFLVITIISKLISQVFWDANNLISNMSKSVEICLPTLITLSEFSGGFGSVIFKPITAISSFFVTNITKNTFLPILNVSMVLVIIGNFSSTIKLNSLHKTLLSFVKWSLGIITLVFTIVLTAQGIVNMQYNGLSFKILKYATGSLIPIVGGFVSGGLDVLLSSAVLVKNSFGLILVIYIIAESLGSGVIILIVSFLLKFIISLTESLIDSKFITLINGVCEIFNYLTAVIFISGFAYVLVCFSIINSTALII